MRTIVGFLAIVAFAVTDGAGFVNLKFDEECETSSLSPTPGGGWQCFSDDFERENNDDEWDDSRFINIDLGDHFENAFQDSVLQIVIWNEEEEQWNANALSVVPPVVDADAATTSNNPQHTEINIGGCGTAFEDTTSREQFKELVEAGRKMNVWSPDMSGNFGDAYECLKLEDDNKEEDDTDFAYLMDVGSPGKGRWRLRVNPSTINSEEEKMTLYIAVRVITTYEDGMLSAKKIMVPNELETSLSDIYFLPGQEIHVPIGHNFARDFYMIRKFQARVTVSDNRMPSRDSETNSEDWEPYEPYKIEFDDFEETVINDDGTDVTWDCKDDDDARVNPDHSDASCRWINTKVVGSPNNGDRDLTTTINYLAVTGNEWPERLPGHMSIDTPMVGDGQFVVDNSDGYDWSNDDGPFWSLSLTIPDGGIEEFPTVYDGSPRRYQGSSDDNEKKLDMRHSRDYGDQVEQKIYMAKISDHDWNVTLTFSGVEDDSDNTADGSNPGRFTFHVEVLDTVEVSENVPKQEPLGSTGWSSSNVDPQSYSWYNSDYYNFTNNPWESKAEEEGKELDPIRRRRSRIIFFRVKLGTYGRALLENFAVEASASSIEGECKDYRDCTTDSSHPSENREDDSANGDAERFTTCRLFSRERNGYLIPTSRCTECDDDRHCGEQQYCQNDHHGIETVNDHPYIASSFLHNSYYLCQEKSSDVLGKKCRTDTADTKDFDAPEVLSDDTDGFAPNYGFCGEAVFYNNSGVAGESDFASTAYQGNGVVYKTLWSGICFNGECQECVDFGDAFRDITNQPGDSQIEMIPPGRRCLNGRIKNVWAVDFTVRTLTRNTIAGTLVAFLIFFIAYIGCFAMQMMADANRHREHFGEEPLGIFGVLYACACGPFCCFKSLPDYAQKGSGGAGSQRNPVHGDA